MARTRRRDPAASWARECYGKSLWKYHSDRGASWNAPWSGDLKKEANSKCRSHFRQELAKWYKLPEYPIVLNKKYGNPWNWD